jgi:septum formation protein
MRSAGPNRPAILALGLRVPRSEATQHLADHSGIILASTSPRRRAIFGILGVPFEPADVAVDEGPYPGEAAVELARRLARAKALAGARSYPRCVTIGADTVVALDGELLGKPDGPEDAAETLRRLRGRAHEVITGVACARWSGDPAADPSAWVQHAVTRVWMRAYSDEEIRRYVESGDPFDKAGSYAIQHPVFRPVERLEGCYLNVVGLPPPETRAVLTEAGVTLPPTPTEALLQICPGCSDRWVLGA